MKSPLIALLFKHRLHCWNCLSKNLSTNKSSNLYEEILEEARKYKRELKLHNKSSFRHRELAHSIDNINQVIAEMERKRQKLDDFVNDISQLPSHVSIEVLSNGTTHLSSSVLIRTPLKNYLFNCPEGTSRFLPTLRVRPANTCDLFVTRARWENIGGISGFLLSKEVNHNTQTRIHGPQKIKQYLECLRPFLDADFGSLKYPVSVEERTYDSEVFEDPAMKVTYVPLFCMNTSRNQLISNQMVDVAYLIELKDLPPRIDINKIIEQKVPNGPLIGKLKAGETIVLDDGRTVYPEDVRCDSSSVEQKPTLLVVEVDRLEKLECLANNPALMKFCNAGKTLHYIVHFTLDATFSTKEYRSWMDSFGENCKHIVVNSTGEALPQGEGPYHHQVMLNTLSGEIFPLLHPVGFRGIVSQDYDVSDTNVILANILQRFSMRGALSKDDPIVLDLSVDELGERLKTSPNGKQRIDEFRECYNKVVTSIINDKYPSVVFLGTASAVPSKYRNVSGHLLRLSENSSILVDCGEGTYGQMRALFGPSECERALTHLNAIVITHAHQDHMNGLYLVIIKRIEAFANYGLEYKPLVVVCNRNVRKPMGIYSRNFDDIEKYIKIVDASLFMKSVSPFKNADNDFTRRVMIDITLHLPPSLYSAESWNLRQVKAVQVHHTRMAVGYIFTDYRNGRKIVFSGDTMPCELLVNQGRDADLLIHECTFEDGFEDDAFRKRHSTMSQAIDVGRRMAAKNVILSHFSARYTRIPTLPDYLLQAGNVSVAMDNMVVRFDHLPVLPKLLPVFRELFSAELFDIQVKQSQRSLRNAAAIEKNKKEGTMERRVVAALLDRTEIKAHTTS